MKRIADGVKLGFCLAVVYGCAFLFYSIVRSSLQIMAVLSPGELLEGTLLANTFALLAPTFFFVLIFGIVAGVLQSLALLLVRGFTALVPNSCSPVVAALLGFITATGFVTAIHIAAQRMLGIYFAALWPAGYLFWLGLPSLIFIGATTWVSWWSTDKKPLSSITNPQNMVGLHGHAVR